MISKRPTVLYKNVLVVTVIPEDNVDVAPTSSHCGAAVGVGELLGARGLGGVGGGAGRHRCRPRPPRPRPRVTT